MEVLEIVLPVLAMIILGILCRKWKLLDQSGVNNMKTLVTNLRKKESSAYASTTNSLYCVVSILVYITLAVAG